MELPAVLAGLQEPIEAELRSLISTRQEPLYRMMEYALGWVEQDLTPRPGPGPLRLHASLCLLTGQVLGTTVPQALPAAAAVELVQHYSLVHDDIRDGNPDRDGRPTVWWLWGPAQAINAGDGLDALARLALLGLGSRGMGPERVLSAAGLLDRASLCLCEGQYQEANFQEQLQVSGTAYLRMAENRAGALMGCALELGALVARVDEPRLPHYQKAGQKLGLALQIQRDLWELWGGAQGKSPAGELLNKKKSLPVVYALETAPAQTKRELGTFYLKRVLDPKDVPRVLELLDAAGSRRYCQEEVERAKQEALGALAQAGLADTALAEFQGVIEFLFRREG